MLTEICEYLRNYFILRSSDIHRGDFTIENGSIQPLSFLQNNQYFRIRGSVFNDGVHQYGKAGLTDETFSGEIWAMAVPPAVIALDAEIAAWVAANSAAINSPYQSESFGGYSYAKASGSNADGSGGVTWQNQFASRLRLWKKVAVL